MLEVTPEVETTRPQEAGQQRRLGGNMLRVGGGILTFSVLTAAGYRLGAEVFAQEAPSQGLEYVYTGLGVVLGAIGGGFAATIVMTADVERSSLLKRMRSTEKTTEEPAAAEEIQYSDDLSHMLPSASAATGVYDFDSDLSIDWLKADTEREITRLVGEGALVQAAELTIEYGLEPAA